MDNWRESTAAYALGTMTDPERIEFETHLLTCPECAAEVRSFAEVGALLAESVPSVAADENLMRARAGIVHAIRPATVAQPVRPRGRVIVGPWLVAAASLAAAVGLGAYSARLRDTASQAKTVVVVLAASDLIRVDLAGQPVAPQASARAFWSQSRGLVFTASNLPPLPEGRTYQLWIISGDTPVGAGLLKPKADGNADAVFDAPPNISKAAAMAVTIEPDGGRPAPTGDKYLVGLLN